PSPSHSSPSATIRSAHPSTYNSTVRPGSPAPSAHTRLLPSAPPLSPPPFPRSAPAVTRFAFPNPLPASLSNVQPDSLSGSAPHMSPAPFHIPPRSHPLSSSPALQTTPARIGLSHTLVSGSILPPPAAVPVPTVARSLVSYPPASSPPPTAHTARPAASPFSSHTDPSHTPPLLRSLPYAPSTTTSNRTSHAALLFLHLLSLGLLPVATTPAHS